MSAFMNQNLLTVAIFSFSYKNAPTWKELPHGGGFVFDCRGLPNPGREERYKGLTGLDIEVQEYLRNTAQFEPFFNASVVMVEQTIAHHQSRGFEHLTVAYGCTGGQHRSVFCAETLANHLRSNVSVVLEHRETANWPKKS
jgi:RNase adaptor protein for sRNA GlmZ degradation